MHTTGSNEQILSAELMTTTAALEGDEISRRGALRKFLLLGAASMGATVATELERPADAANLDPPTPPEPPTPQEAAAKRAQAELEALETRSDLDRVLRRQVEKSLEEPSWLEKVGRQGGAIAGSVGVLTAAIGGVAAAVKFFSSRTADRKAREATRELEEDNSFRHTIDRITETLHTVDTSIESGRSATYTPLLLAYSQLRTFANAPRFTEPLFNVATSLLRARAKAQHTPEEVEARINADRELLELLCMVLPKLPRQGPDGSAILPDANGISLNGMRYFRGRLENVSLEGAWLQGLTITGSLAGSYLKLARLHGTTFGQPGLVCDLRGADLSQAELGWAHFGNVLIDDLTKFGAGQEGDPRATFGTVIPHNLEPAQVQQKLAAARVVMQIWKQAHPEASPPAGSRTSRLEKLLRTITGPRR